MNIFFLAAFIGLLSSVCHADLIYNAPNFNNIYYVGTAYPGQEVVVLNGTSQATNQRGAAWYNVAQDVTKSFQMDMVASIRTIPGLSAAADGLAFVINANPVLDSNTAQGSAAGYTIGYDIPNTVAVELDIYYNDGFGEPNNPHMGLQSCGPTTRNTAVHASSCALNSAVSVNYVVNTPNYQPVTITCVYDNVGKFFSTYFNGNFVYNASVDLTTKLNLIGGSSAYMGITASTGGLWEIVEWKSMNFAEFTTITSVKPAYPRTGETVTLTGTNFKNTGAIGVYFDNTVFVTATYIDSTTIKFVVPSTMPLVSHAIHVSNDGVAHSFFPSAIVTVVANAVSASMVSYGCATKNNTLSFRATTAGGTAPYRYGINNGPITANNQFNVNSQGFYTITSVDSNGVTVSGVAFIGPAASVVANTVPYIPYGTQAGFRTSAVGSSDAFFTAFATGTGLPSYTYALYPAGASYAFTAGTDGQFTGLPAGSYSLIATDANKCQSLASTVVINTPTLPSPPTIVNANATNLDPLVSLLAIWTPPAFNGYADITGYVVNWGYMSRGAIVWSANQNVASLSATSLDSFQQTTARYVRVASVNLVGVGAYSPTFSFSSFCGAGVYADTNGVCTNCTAGTNTFGRIGKTVCRPCASGTYSGSGYPTCASCTGNTYSNAGAASCTNCPLGSRSFLYACEACPPGSYSYNTATCTPCAANTYSDNSGASSCASCPAGTTSQQGATACVDENGYKKK